MNEFKKKFTKGGPAGGYSRGGASRPSFGGSRRPDSRGFDAPKELYKTSCAKCKNACEVPFRPNGMKPVYCKDCFVRDDERSPRGGASSSRDSFAKKGFGNDRPGYDSERAPSRQTAPEPDSRIGAILRELQNVNEKLDALSLRLENTAYSAILSASAEKATKPEKAEKKVKVAKKAVSSKKPAKKR